MVEPTAAASHHAGVLVAMGSLETAVQFGWKKLDPTPALAGRPGHRHADRLLVVHRLRLLRGHARRRRPGQGAGRRARWRNSDLFDERERVVLEYAEAATGCPAEVSEELAARIRAHLSDAEFVELAAWVALENFRSRFNAGLGLRSQGFSDACEIPCAATSTTARCLRRCLTPRPTRPRSRSGARSSSASPIACWAVRRTPRTSSRTPPSAGCVASDGAGRVGAGLSRHHRHPALPRPARLGPRQRASPTPGPWLPEPVVRRRDGGGRAGRLVVARLPRAARGADAARARRLPAPRRLRLPVRRGRPARWGGRPAGLPPTRGAGAQADRGRDASASTPTCATAAS